MPTTTQRTASINEAREGDAPGFIPGTESSWPSRTDKRRLARERKHRGMLALAKMKREAANG
jgi:hypothetical protein